MNKILILLATLSVLLVAVTAVAQETAPAGPMGMRYGNPPPMPMHQGGRYPAPPMNPQMMRQMMAQQRQNMQEIQQQRKAEADEQKQASGHLADKQMQQHDGHMARIEKSLANIEKLMQEMIDLMKSRY